MSCRVFEKPAAKPLAASSRNVLATSGRARSTSSAPFDASVSQAAVG
jgi:hypothetical protein